MRDNLIESLVSICGDYKHIEFDKNHVEIWIQQFDEADQEFILEQLVNILKKTYISEKKVDTFISNVVNDIKKRNNCSQTTFGILVNNTHGESQDEFSQKLLKALSDEEIVCGLANLDDYKENKYQKYLYVDDIIYTGNTFKYAFKDFEFDENKSIKVYIFGIYTQSEKYLAGEPEGIFLKGKYYLKINNLLGENNFGILHPLKEDLTDGEKGGRLYKIYSDFLFDSEEKRRRFENIFYYYGKKKLEGVEEPAPNLKPLGYSVISHLGFGNMFVFYRNISNNSPLALWYGDYIEYINGNNSGKVLGEFYPLFPRKTN